VYQESLQDTELYRPIYWLPKKLFWPGPCIRLPVLTWRATVPFETLMAIFQPEDPSKEKKTSDFDILSGRARSGSLIETTGDEESSLDLLFILRTDASCFPDLLYLASKLHGITYYKTVMHISTVLRTSNLTS